ncbi:MAG: YggS family pyridoxal phosphate-dependent enzyme [Bacteroidales bacterium]|jgi:PLP dependent protein|nr:YggS family pyridoxal phosphate-dependent enzyme [Bacteroidales bacterium]
MSIRTSLLELKAALPSTVTLVAVSKFHPLEAIQEAYETGQRVFGESRVQELVEKQRLLPSDIEWHLIGHLQTNKVKQVVPFISLIHSVDSLKVLQEINKEAARIGRVVPCLLQVHIADEESKFGFSPEACIDLVSSGQLLDYRNVSIRGLMGMATFTDDRAQVEREFKSLKQLFDTLKQTHFPSDPTFSVLSMGMSDDYPLAVQTGSTMVRVGSLIFGNRTY